MSTTTVAESTAQPAQSLALANSPTNGGSVPQSSMPQWMRRAVRAIGGIRLPRLQGHRPEQVFLAFDGESGAKKEGGPDESPKSSARRLRSSRVAEPSTGAKKPEFGRRIAEQQGEAMSESAASAASSEVGASDAGVLAEPFTIPTAVAPEEEDFEMESLRFEALHLVEYRKIGNRPTYVFDELIKSFVMPGASGRSTSAADDLARRLSTHNERPIEAVVYFNAKEGYEAVFAVHLTHALLRRYGNREVRLHACIQSGDAGKEEFRLAEKYVGAHHPLEGKRIVLAVGPLTKSNWDLVARQVVFLKGIAMSVRVATIAKIGYLPKWGHASIRVEAFTSYGREA